MGEVVVGPASVADWIIETFPLDSAPRKISDLILDFGNSKRWFTSEMQGQQKAESWAITVSRRLTRHLNASRRDWHPCRFDFNESDAQQIQGSCRPVQTDSVDVSQTKAALLSMDDYRSAVRALDARDFEHLCGAVLRLLGCRSPRVTPRSGDQGIDFFGELKMIDRLDQRYVLGGPDRLLSAWIVGQAKHYDGDVGPSEIREFAGSHFLASMGVSYDDGRALLEYKAAALQARYVLFVTTGRLTAGTRKLVSNAGIVMIDEARLSAILALHGVATTPAGVDRSAFTAWLAETSPDEDETEDEDEDEDETEDEDEDLNAP